MSYGELTPDIGSTTSPDFSGSLASVTPLHPPQEGVFDSGTHFFFHGRVQVERSDVDWTLEVPENLAYEGLTGFVPGYSGIKGSSRGPRGGMAHEGFATFSYTPARKGSLYSAYENPQIIHAKAIHRVSRAISEDQSFRKEAPNARAILLGQKILLSHSMGGLGATEYASYATDDVDAIFNLAAVGFGHPTLSELAVDIPKGAAAAIWHELVPAISGGHLRPSLRNIRDLAHYFASFRVLLEGNSCLRHDSREQIAALRNLGVFVAYQAYQHDILVRPDVSVADHVDHHAVMEDAGHLAPIFKYQQVASHVASVLLNRQIGPATEPHVAAD